MKKKVVYIDMVADLFHRGHVEFINKAKAYGDYLIVGLHPDDIVKKYKRKPIYSYEDRKKILESITDVNLVVEDCRFHRSPTIFDNVKKYNVNIVIHADDFKPHYVEKIEKLGVKFIQVPYYPYTSTTKTLQKIRAKNTLKNALKAGEKLVIVSSADAITGQLVEEFGYDGIWVSSFEVSARYGLVDNGTISMTEMANTAKSVIDAINIPVIVDVDNGYGGIHNFVRAVKCFERIGASAICVEDNLFPKKNSLWGGKIPIETMENHGAKIKAGKEVQKTNEFCIMARTEALLRGYGMEEAIKRANYYADCGADLILVHCREKTGKEALEIPKYWKRYTPLVIIPSKFPHLTEGELFKAGFSVIIYANQIQRTIIKAIKDNLKLLKTEKKADALNNQMCSLNEMRNLTPIAETEHIEEKYGKKEKI